MISEPEMTGGVGTGEGSEAVGDSDRRPVGQRRGPWPWLWALGGAAASSVLGAAAVLHFGGGSAPPDALGYRHDQPFCPASRLASLRGASAPKDARSLSDSGLLKHPALDQVQCFVTLKPEARAGKSQTGWSISYTVGITVALHKNTDPRGEFE